MVAEEVATSHRAAVEVTTDLSLAVVDDRKLGLLVEHSHHEVGVLLTPVAEVEPMCLHRPRRANKLLSTESDLHRATGRLRSAARILAGSPESELHRQSRFVLDRAHGLGPI